MQNTILKYALQNAVNYNGKASLGNVIGKIIGLNPEFKKNIREIQEKASSIIQEVNKMTLEQQTKRLEEIAPELLVKEKGHEEKKLPELQNVNGKVVMRLAPFPSGALHIGNAYPAVMNDEYAKKYKGELLLVIDDTIGSEEKPISRDAYKLIPSGLRWLGVKFNKKILYKSNRLRIYYKHAKELIKKGNAYVCFCDAETLRNNRVNSIECNCRSSTTKKNLGEFNNMIKKKYKEGQAVLRLKTSMQHPNPAFRDRVLFRISYKEHPRAKKKYGTWPLLEFSWAIDDHLLGITHVIRGKELMIESEMEKYIWDIFGWVPIVLMHSGLLHLEGIKISKSKARKEVESGEYFGWDDPRTWSLQSLERRGFEPEAIRNLFLEIGLTNSEITVPIESLYTENRRLIDKRCNRYSFVENPRKIMIKNAPKLNAKIPMHPDFPERGNVEIRTSNEFYITDNLEEGKLYRFIHLFNFKDNEFMSMEQDAKLNAKLIHWLPASRDVVDIEVLMDDGSIKKGIGHKSLKKLKRGAMVQFIRFGFARLDKKEKNKLTFWFTHK